MASLRNLLEQRNSLNDNNIEAGQVWGFKGTYNINALGFCWVAPAAGKAVIEIWGGAGGAGGVCCCGFGFPGNAAAYSKKTVNVTAGWIVCGCVGHGGTAQTSADSRCGYCGCATGLTILNASAVSQGCMCAQPGTGGFATCSTNVVNGICCFIAQGYCNTIIGTGCGVICNIGGGRGSSQAQAYGGDINVAGLYGKRFFTDSNVAYWGWDCTPYSAGLVGCEGGYIITCLNCAYWDQTIVNWHGWAAAKRTLGQTVISCCFEDYFPYSTNIARTTGKECHQAWGMATGSINTCAGTAAYGASGSSGYVRIKLIS